MQHEMQHEKKREAEASLLLISGDDRFGVDLLIVVPCGQMEVRRFGIARAADYADLLTVILGVLLFVVQLVGFLNTSGMVEIVINIVLLVIPYYYLHNAYKIYRAK